MALSERASSMVEICSAILILGRCSNRECVIQTINPRTSNITFFVRSKATDVPLSIFELLERFNELKAYANGRRIGLPMRDLKIGLS
jgi:hypothetical protein